MLTRVGPTSAIEESCSEDELWSSSSVGITWEGCRVLSGISCVDGSCGVRWTMSLSFVEIPIAGGVEIRGGGSGVVAGRDVTSFKPKS